MLYISPAFPSRGLVFEQNELMGLLHNSVSIRIFSCRRTDASKETNQFAEPLLGLTECCNMWCVAAGFGRAICTCPLALVKVLWLVIRGCLNPLMAPKVIGACLCALHLYRSANCTYNWIHADFGGNTATVALFLAVLTGIPFSYKVHAYDIYSRSLNVMDPLRRKKAHGARAILAEHADGQKAYSRFAGVPIEKVRIHYSCVRTDAFRPCETQADGERILALGRLVAKKGFDILIRAVDILCSEGCAVAVDIHGYGPEQEHLSSLIEELQLTDVIRIHGAYDNNKLVSMFASATMLVMPSVIDRCGDRDGVPTVIYEAMACGIPVIASAVSGIPEVVHDGLNGVLVEPGDIAGLAAAIKQLTLDRTGRRKLADQARRDVVDRHDYRAAAEDMCAIFSECLRKP